MVQIPQTHLRPPDARADGPKRSRRSPAPLIDPARLATASDQLIKLPMAWFFDPLLHAMSANVAPPTKKTRRKQRMIKLPMPTKVFEMWLRDLTTEDHPELKRDDDGRLIPTKTTSSTRIYKYTIKKASVVEKLWRAEFGDLTRGVKKKMKPTGHRSLGCAKLNFKAGQGYAISLSTASSVSRAASLERTRSCRGCSSRRQHSPRRGARSRSTS